MRHEPSHSECGESGDFPVWQDLPAADDLNANSADEVIGEMGLVLVAILGMVVAVNLLLTSMHIY